VAFDRNRRILTLALPIIGGMVSQNVMNLVDTAMVGQLGQAALAAVGLASFVNFLSQAFLTGLGTGVQAVAARRLGEGKGDEAAVPLHGALIIAVVLGLPLSILLYTFAGDLFPLLASDPAIVEQGVPYWRARLLAVVAVGLNFSFRGFWNGVDLSRLYMRTLVVMHVTNLALNYVLIFGKLGFPALGAEGAGLGTAIATWLGTATYFALGMKHARKSGFLRAMPSLKTVLAILKLSTAPGLQQVFFSGSLTALFWIIGQVGTTELAAANVLINVSLVALLPGLGFGMASATLVGQALGRGQPDDARRWGWEVARVSALAMAVLGLPMMLFPGHVIGLFVGAAEAAQVIAAGSLPLRLFGGIAAVEGVHRVLQFSLMGAGDMKRVMVLNTSLQWGLLLPLAYLVGPVLGFGLFPIWCVYLGTSVVGALVFVALWQGSRWQHIRV
jgi:multidrug resistance protein, MATE family